MHWGRNQSFVPTWGPWAAFPPPHCINNAGQVRNSSLANATGALIARHPNKRQPATDVIPTLPGGTFSSVNFNAINSSASRRGNGTLRRFGTAFALKLTGTLNELGTLVEPTSRLLGITTLVKLRRSMSSSPLQPAWETGVVLFPYGSQQCDDQTIAWAPLFLACRSSLGAGINKLGAKW